jgi:uncharacterized protein
MPRDATRFLTAEWRHLVMLNFEIDPAIIRPFVPAGTELDDHNGKNFVSLVSFLFLDTRVLGVPIPFHRNFEEVNLRLYVRRQTKAGWRRGVVFIKELVPRRAIAWTARTLYGENYVAVKMGHRVDTDEARSDPPRLASYWWTFRGRQNRLEMGIEGDAAPIDEEFITEHYWGYSRQRDGDTVEYKVEHRRWRVWEATHAYLDCDVAGLYGQQFVEPMSQRPASAFLADGSPITVFSGRPLSDGGIPD